MIDSYWNTLSFISKKAKEIHCLFKRANIIQEMPVSKFIQFSFYFSFFNQNKHFIYFIFLISIQLIFVFHWILCPQFLYKKFILCWGLCFLYITYYDCCCCCCLKDIANGGFNNELTCATYPLFKGLSSGSILLLNRFG